MTSLPDPKAYSDPVVFLRASHAIVLGCLNRLEALTNQVEKEGLLIDPKTNEVWTDLLHFFSVVIIVHERDEELALFPVVLRKVPHTGFQPKNTPMRFLLEGHEVLEKNAMFLVKEWQSFVFDQTPPSMERQKVFLASAHELIKEYHEHIKTEEELVYAKANDLLTPAERQQIMQIIIGNHAPVVTTSLPQYDTPTASLPITNFSLGASSYGDDTEEIDTDATGEPYEVEEEEEEEEEESGKAKGTPNGTEDAEKNPSKSSTKNEELRTKN